MYLTHVLFTFTLISVASCCFFQEMSFRFKLLYFEDRGSADLIKLLFSISKQSYEPVQIKLSEWNVYRTFMPFEQLPVLVLNDTIRIAQTNTICRFLAGKFNLNGSNEIEAVQCDMVNEQLKDCIDHTARNLQEKDSSKKHQQMQHFTGVILPKTLNGYEKMLSLNSSSFIVGDSLSWADLALVNAWEWLDENSRRLLDQYPLVKRHNEFIRTLPKVSEALKELKPLRVFKVC